MNNQERNIVVIIDFAHGSNVKGKQSPDGSHKEWQWSREIGVMLSKKLQTLGFQVQYSNPCDIEMGLTKRKNFATNLIVPEGKTKFLLSLHNNAAGNGNEWKNASGIEIYTTPGQTLSDVFADKILDQLESAFPDYKYRYDHTDGDRDKESRFTVLMGSGYYACLLEFLFQDNVNDVKLLKSTKVKYQLVIALSKALIEMDRYLSENGYVK